MATPEPVKAAMGTALERGHTRYAPSSGIPELRRAILEKVRDAERHPLRRRRSRRRQRRHAGPLRGLLDAARSGRRGPPVLAVLDSDRRPHRRITGRLPALVPTVEARRRGLAAALAAKTTAADEGPLLEFAEQPDGRRLLAGRDRGGRGVRARARPRRHLRRGVRGSRLRGRAERRDRVAARDERADDHLFHAVEELLDDGLAPRLRHRRRSDTRPRSRRSSSIRPTASPRRRSGPASRPSPAAPSSSRNGKRAIARGATAGRGPPGRGLRDRAAAGRSVSLPEDTVLAAAPTRARPRASCSTRRRSRPCPASCSVRKAKATCGSPSPSPRR